MRTYVPKQDEITRDWLVVDATELVLGRLATEVASRLRGKHKPCYTPFLDTGDFVIVVNAEKVRLTGQKLDDKYYYRHSGRPGSLKTENAKHLIARSPEKMVRQAVWGMLPKNRLGRQLLSKLKIYRGAEHPHEAQQPQTLKV